MGTVSKTQCGGAAAIAILLLLLPGTAVAAGACPIRLAGKGVERWENVVSALETKLADGRSANDCAQIDLVVDGKRGRISFSTADGRTAVREVGDPSELAATALALGALDPPTDPPASAPVARELPSVVPVAPAPRLEMERTPAPAEAPAITGKSSSVLYGALLGGRIGAGGLASPMLDAYATIVVDRWQIGVVGRAEPHYVNVTDASAQPRSAALGAGVTAGRRIPLSAQMILVTGASLVVAAVHEDRSTKGQPNTTHADGRLGGYLGVVFPARSSTRFRTNLVAELTPPRAVERSAEGLALSPWWGVALMMGVELGSP